MVEGAGGKDRQWNACGQGGLGRSPHGAVSAGHPQHLGPRRRALHHLRHVVVGGEFDHRDVGQVALHPGQHVVPLAAVRRRIDLGGAEHETGRDVRRVVGTGRHPREAHQAGQRGQGHAQRGYLECHRAREGGRTGRVTAGKRGRGGNAPGDARERYPQQRWAWPPVQPFGHLVGDLAAQRVEPTVGGHGYLDPDGPSPVVSPDPGCSVSDQAIPGVRWARGSGEAPVRTAGGVPAGACVKALRWLGMSSTREC